MSAHQIRLLSPSRLAARILGIVSVLVIAGVSVTPSYSRSLHRRQLQLAPMSRPVTAVNWMTVHLPGASEVVPGTRRACDMAPYVDNHSHRAAAYYFVSHKQDYAVVPAACRSLNQAQVNFFLFSMRPDRKPQLREVVFQSDGAASGLLTRAVPTAAVAASHPHSWSGWFQWAGPNEVGTKAIPARTVGVQIKGLELSIRGLVIPVGGQPPTPTYTDHGTVLASYIFGWHDGLFDFVRATAGVAPAKA